MAKVKSAKEKITLFLKAKGFDTAEIKDAFDELDAADVDLDKMAGELGQFKEVNDKWASFWNEQAGPTMAQLEKERDGLKAQMDKLREAGFQIGELKPPVTPKPTGDQQYVTPEQLQKFQSDIASASSAVMKSLTKINMKHFRTFNEEPDLDAIEKLMGEGKARDIDHAYELWSAPKYEARRKEDTDKAIAEGIKKGVQDEISKMGIVRRPKSKAQDDIEVEELAKAAKAPKDDKGPGDRELREAFINDWNSLN